MIARPSSLRLAVVLALLAASSSLTLAQTPPPGRLLASNCFQCHGTNGKGPGFDRLAGESASEIYEELVEMRAKASRTATDIMAKHAMGYTDAQLRQLAQWLSTQR